MRTSSSAISAIGVWPEVKHTGACDVTQTRDHLVECLTAIGFASKHVYATSRTEDVFSAERSSLRTNPVDFPVDNRIDTTVVARQNSVRDLVLLWKLHFFLLLVG